MKRWFDIGRDKQFLTSVSGWWPRINGRNLGYYIFVVRIPGYETNNYLEILVYTTYHPSDLWRISMIPVVSQIDSPWFLYRGRIRKLGIIIELLTLSIITHEITL